MAKKVTLYDADGRSVTTTVPAEAVRLRAAGYTEKKPADDKADAPKTQPQAQHQAKRPDGASA
jgi:hypothetical protein